MKKLIAFMASCAFVSNAFAAEGTEFSHSGEFRVRYVNNLDPDGVKDAGTGATNSFAQRLKLGVTMRAGDKLTAHGTLLANSVWGSNVTQEPNFGLEDISKNNGLVVGEAYGAWMMNDQMMLKLGRGSLKIADGRVIDTNDYFAVANAFDGAMWAYDLEFAKFSLFGVKGWDSDAEARFSSLGEVQRLGSDVENVFYGLNVDFKGLPEFIKLANLHVMQVDRGGFSFTSTATSTPPSALISVAGSEQIRYGVTVGGDIAGADFNVTYAGHTGEDKSTPANKISGSMLDAKAGYTLVDLMNLNFHVGYHMDSADKASTTDKDEGYDAFFYDRHFNAGLMDVFGWGGLTYIYGGLGIEPMENFTVGLDYYMFTKSDKNSSYTTNSGTSWTSAADTDEELGSEIDLVLTKKYENGLTMLARYGMLTPGKAFDAGGVKDAYQQIMVQAEMKF